MNKIGPSCCTRWSRAQTIADHWFHTKIYADSKEPRNLYPALSFASKYDKQTTDHILDVFNKLSVDDLTRYNIAKGRLQKIAKYRKTHGPFGRIEQVLEVDDFGVKILEKIVESIAAGPSKESVDETQYNPSPKDLQNVTTPLLPNEKRSAINTVTSICVGVEHVSWAKMECNGRLVLWDSHSDFEWPKKDDPMLLHKLALKLRRILPLADAYVTESVSLQPIPSGNQLPGSSLRNLQRLQLTTMLVTLFATQFNPPSEDEKEASWMSNENLFYLRRQIVPQLFGLVVGKESVSPHTVINQIIDNSISQSVECIAPITINNYELDVYNRSDAVKKEALSQALLTSAAFCNLAVNHNPNSFKALHRG